MNINPSNKQIRLIGIHGNGLLKMELKKRAESRQAKVVSKNARNRVKRKLYLFLSIFFCSTMYVHLSS